MGTGLYGSDPMQRSFRMVAAACGTAAAVIGGFFLISWLSGSMTYAGASTITIKTNASLSLLLCGLAIALAVPGSDSRSRLWAVRSLALFALVIGGLTLLEHLFNLDLGIDQLLAREGSGALGVIYPNRMGPPASFSFTVCGVALLLMVREKGRGVRFSQWLGILLSIIALLGILGYLYHAQGLYGLARYTAIAGETTVGILLLGIGILCTRPTEGLMAVVTAREPGGVAVRTLLLPALLVPIILGWLRLQGEWHGLYERYFGTSILILSLIVIFSALIYHTGKRLGSVAAGEQQALEELRRTQTLLLEAASLSHTGAWEWDPATDMWTFSDEWLRIHGVKRSTLTPEEFLDIAHPEDRTAINEAFQALRNGVKPYQLEHRIIRQDNGEVRTVMAQGQFARDEGGRVVRVYGFAQDITVQKRAEQAVRESEKRLRNVIEHLAEGLIVIDLQGGALHWNRMALDMFQYGGDEDEITFLESLLDLYELRSLDGKLLPAQQWPIKRVMRGEEFRDFEVVVIHKKKSWQRVYDISGGIIEGAAGEPSIGLITMRDVTARKAAEEALRASEELLRKVLETLPVAVWILDHDGTVLHANKAAHDIGGEIRYVGVGEYDEFKGWRLDTGQQLKPEDWAGTRAIQKGETILNDEVEIESFDGTRKIILNSGIPIKNERGEVTGAITINQDVTASKQAEVALRESEKKFRAIFQHAAVGMGRVSFTDARWIDVNEAFCHMLGYTVDEFLTTPWPQITHPEDLDLDLVPFRRMAAGELENYRVEKRFFHKEGQVVWARLTLSLVRDAQGQPDYEIAVIEDITYRKEAEEELRRAKDELELRVKERTRELEQAYDHLKHETEERIAAVEHLRRNEQLLIQQSRLAAMGEMLGNIAHQWRQPLNILGLLIQQLPMSMEFGQLTRESLDQEVAKGMKLILHLSQTINDFRNFLQEDKVKKLFSVNDAIATTVSLFEATLKAMEVKVELKPSEELFVNGHRNEFCQVLMNIITNARDAFRERKIEHPGIVISLFKENDRTVVTIADNAGGIPEEIIDRIFDPYFTTKGPDKGTGIGLFMSKSIIEKSMNGSLTARNTAEGAEFRIEV